MKSTIITLALLGITGILAAQSEKTLKEVLKLAIPVEGGANGASVAWHPVQKKYYAAMAGNIDFSLSVYDAKGKRLSPTSQKTMFDVRGLWYNPAKRTLQTNGYKTFGWGEYVLNSQGFPMDIKVIFSGMNQPAEQSVGAFNHRDKQVYFFNEDGDVDIYDLKDGDLVETIELSLGQAKTAGDSYNTDRIDDYNGSTLIYSGIPGAEIGLLNHYDNQIELYSLNTGRMTRTLSLPETAPYVEFLNFSFCNDTYWLFNKTTRVWHGYR